MKVRLADIAREAAVSEATVSRVLNGKPGVTEETRRLVVSVAARLGRDTSSVYAHSEDIVGILAPDLTNPIFPQMISAIDDELAARGMSSMIVARAFSVERERDALESLVAAGACGLIVLSGHHANSLSPVDHYRLLLERGVRLAYINGRRENLSGTFISVDETYAVSAAVEHLAALGHRSVGLAVGDEHTYPVREKTRAFNELIERGNTPAKQIAYTDFSHEGGFQAALELVRRGCTGILCGSDVMALGVIEGAASMGLRVPGDISVVGFDDIAFGRYTSPALTTIRQPVPVIARAAVNAVIATDTEDRRAPRADILVRPELVVRGSTAPPAD
ncbi:LacI family transcriptional regulator [Dermabacteraceae bacterium TAE3-ERU27]|nr:LacI family transcriptional regulator [Dermabacteraceae bacterium TAE3-ERU27]